MTLPTPRNLLTSLFTSLAAPSSTPTPANNVSAPNPLRNLPEEKTALLSTLHVIFPSLLLPALDLLDRGLVTGVRTGHGAESGPRGAGVAGSKEGDGPSEGVEAAGKADDEGSGTIEGVGGVEGNKGAGGAERDEGAEGTEGTERPEVDFYIVRSLASTMRKVGKEREGRYSLVTLRAWNCTCPSFTLDAFPPAPPPIRNSTAEQNEQGTRAGMDGEGHGLGDGGRGTGGGQSPEEGREGDGGQRTTGNWSFGGTSTDGLSLGDSIPCCKHLLACVLAERWGAVLGSYVPVKTIQKSEVAGLVVHV